ncbi:glycosyltransferase family 2 protein [Idiomarina aminovorans]|uniref:glycosyltransferase family 2 protein n=1 Tax=Idiomarina aminovorans TaxID=2914829 RepID=UPI00200322B4|nr:glycosyltransferase family 2 protein [Idiomarina sp. ATCH4]MCK7459137.1 glycosyltransferase family 2 protein [Idiomarina sp. ATCH4]
MFRVSGSQLVSIIIPTFGRPSQLDRAVSSVLKQTYKNIEIIIVDDNKIGDDNSLKSFSVIKRFLNDYDFIRYVKTFGKVGGGEARNIGISASKGNFITFLDDDDSYLPDKIEKQLNAYNNSNLKSLAIVYCRMSMYKEGTKTLLAITNRLFRGTYRPLKENVYGCIAGTPSLFIKADVFNSSLKFRDVSSGQDWVLIYDILREGYSIDYIDDSLVNVYVQDSGRISTGLNKINSLKGEILRLKKEMIHSLDMHEFENAILASHYYQIASALKFNKKIESLGWMYKSARLEMNARLLIKYISGVFLGYRLSIFLKSLRNRFFQRGV